MPRRATSLFRWGANRPALPARPMGKDVQGDGRAWLVLRGLRRSALARHTLRMASSLPTVLADALLLSEDDRAVVAAELLASLHPVGVPFDDDRGWQAEIERRAERVRRGESDGLDFEDVLAELERG